MSRLYKRGNMYWCDFRVDSKRYRLSTGKIRRREAEVFLDNKKREAKEGNLADVLTLKEFKVVELANEYSDFVKHQKSYKISKQFFINEIVNVFGHLKIRNLGVLSIEQWQSKRLEKSKPATVNRITGCLKHMIGKGQEWAMVREETAKAIKGVKPLKEDSNRLRFLSIEQCQILVDCCDEHLKPIVTVALHTGMRRGEILNLKWDQVDLTHSFILLDKTKSGHRREIPINTTLEELFASLLKGNEYLFVNKDGKPYRDIKRSFHTALSKARILDFRFHDLRHTFASHLVMAGIDLTTIKELLGHADIKMTLRYAHLAPGHKKKAVNEFDKILRGVGSFGHKMDTVLENQLEVESHK